VAGVKQTVRSDHGQVARVLISDGSLDVRQLLIAGVGRMGHEGIVVDSVDRALVESAHVLVVEPSEPHCYAVAQRVRNERGDLPIICISIHPPSAESRLLQPVAHLIKPFTLAELRAVIERALGPLSGRPAPATSAREDDG
jgi:DNA-binding response OmpR family regulator